MKSLEMLALALAGGLLSGCAKMPSTLSPVMATAGYAAKEPIATSLFPSDQAVLGDAAVDKILSSKLELPAKAKLALACVPERLAGHSDLIAHVHQIGSIGRETEVECDVNGAVVIDETAAGERDAHHSEAQRGRQSGQ